MPTHRVTLHGTGISRGWHMAWHTLQEAQELTGKSRRTLYRDMAKGLVSWVVTENGHRRLETSELIRAYGEVVEYGTGTSEKTAHRGTPENAAILAELQALRAEVRELRESLHLLEHQPDQSGPAQMPWWRRWLRH